MSTENKGTAAPEAANTPEASAEKVVASIDKGLSASAPEETIDVEDASDEELAEAVESEELSAEEQQAAKIELKKRMKFKINGREVEREVDLGDEDAIRELLQKGFAADERFQSASQLERKMKEFAQLMQMDPFEALKAAGHDPDTLTEKYMQKRVEELSKSPEQLKLEQLQKEIEKERKLRENLENEKLTADQQRIESEYARELDEEITSALTASELPKSPYVIKRIAENLILGIEHGHEDISVHDILPLVERQIKEEIQQMFEAMPEDVIEKILGNNVSQKLRKRRIQSMKKTPDTANSVKATGQSEMKKAAKVEEPAKPTKAKDFFKNY